MENNFGFKYNVVDNVHHALFFHNDHILGKFEKNRSITADNYNVVYHKGFYIKTERETDEVKFSTETYTTGFFGPVKTFFPCPLCIFYVEVEKGTYHNERKKRELVVYLRLHSKDWEWYPQGDNLKKSRSIKLSFINANSDYPFTAFIDRIINFLNEYIDSGHSIFDIDEEKLPKIIMNKHDFNLFTVTKLIDNLQIRVFDESQNRVGKDNYFWTSYEISNFYDNPYFKSLISEVVKQHYSSKYGWDKQNEVLNYSMDHESAYSASYPTREITSDSITSNIKERLKIGFAAKFNLSHFLFEEIKNKKVLEVETTSQL